MRILVTNDDGYLAPGLNHLARELSKNADVTVVAPDSNRSGASSSLSLNRPLSVYTAENGFYYTNGTPTDCVHLAMTAIMKEKPDLVVSGINHGENLGEDTLYSGTVAAAMEGYFFGIPSIAFSQVDRGWAEIESAAKKAADIVYATYGTLKSPFLLNVNIPNKPYEQLKKTVSVRLGRRHVSGGVIRQEDPFGREMFWIGPVGPVRDAGVGTDFHAIENGWVSVSPLRMDLTDPSFLNPLAEALG